MLCGVGWEDRFARPLVSQVGAHSRHNRLISTQGHRRLEHRVRGDVPRPPVDVLRIHLLLRFAYGIVVGLHYKLDLLIADIRDERMRVYDLKVKPQRLEQEVFIFDQLLGLLLDYILRVLYS